MRQRRVVISACLSLALIAWSAGTAAAVWAQSEATTGTVRGTVTDPNGGTVPGAKVTVKNTETGYSRQTETGDDGYFNIPLLPIGSYELRVEKEGFSTLAQSNIPVSVGGVAVVNVALKLGLTSEVVEVKAAAPLVETTRTQVSSVVDETAVRELPVHGRNYLDFVLLTPGVVRDNSGVRQGDINFGGLKGTLNSLQVDGVDNNNNFFGQGLGRPGSRAPFQFSQEAVAEFQVKTNSYGAEYGRAGGAVINVVTKAGTNDLHGALFTYFRDNKLNANKWENNRVGRAKPPLRNWQFGAVASGPIVRDKLFWLFTYDGQRRSDPNPIICPFTPGPGAQPCAQAAADPFIGPKIQDYQRTLNQEVYMGKGDWRITNNHNLSVRYNYQRFTGGGFEAARPTSVFEHTGDSLVRTHTLSGNLVSTLGAHWVNEFRAQWSRDSAPGTANGTGPELVFQLAGITFLELGRNNFSPRATTIKGGQFVDNITYLRGKHTIKYGADFNIQRIFNNFPGLFGGRYVFATVADFADDRKPNGSAGGSVGNYSQAFAGTGTTGPVSNPDFNEYAWFVQDEIRATPNLTLNVGLRYDLQKFNPPSVLNPDAQLAALGISTAQLNTDTNNFAPRVGFAWSPRFLRRLTVVRGGFGIYYGRVPSIMVGTALTQNGKSVLTISNAPGNAAFVPAYPNALSSAPQNVATAIPSIYAFDRGFVNPYVEQGSLAVETEVAKDWSVGVNYLFVKGTHLARSNNINLPNPTLTTISGIPVERFLPTAANPIPDPNFGRITMFQANANSNYHAGVFTLNKRFSHHFMAGANYTWSKAIDDRPDFTSVVPGNTGDDGKMVSNPKNIAEDRGPSDQDYRHRFTLLYAWNLDYLNQHDNFLVRHAFGRWSFSGIFTAQNGRHYSTLLGGDPNNDGNRQTDRAFGVGRNTNTLPAGVSFDIRLGHDFPVYERARFVFLFEAFNLFNHPNFSDVNNTQFNYNSSTNTFSPVPVFGTFAATYDHPGGGGLFPGPGPRTLQLAIKFAW